ncbi:peptidase S9, partial [Pseudoalteromonas sp. S2721]|uniref:prolyl oligopeptidase family serine peptidase n=1 Tax=Pseudoalteromonas sp. S2721 TaxID=579526 RepID=UPI00127F2FD8
DNGPRDCWGYDSTDQLLASRGKALLNANFRRSGGFGRYFERAGHRKWGQEIQYDIIDGVIYLISSGLAD